MKKIKNIDTNKYVNSDKCVNYVYEFNDEDYSISRSEINGIYPYDSWCINEQLKEIVYVIEVFGKLIKENEIVDFSKDDSIVIEKGEKYYWNANCKLVSVCIPKWFEEQHKIILRKW